MPTRNRLCAGRAVLALIGLSIILGCGKTGSSETPLTISNQPPQKELKRPLPQIENPIPDAPKAVVRISRSFPAAGSKRSFFARPQRRRAR